MEKIRNEYIIIIWQYEGRGHLGKLVVEGRIILKRS
jgi:hypothetical protein